MYCAQPLYRLKSNYGLLNQIRLLRKAEAVSLQVLMITPSAGTKLYEGTFNDGMVIRSAAGKIAEPHMYDGNYVVTSKLKRPWRKQLNLLAGYFYFYNPFWLITILLRRKTNVSHKAAGMQIIGMLGLLLTARRTSGWALRLMLGKIERLSEPPASAVPSRSCNARTAAAELIQLNLPSVY